MLSSVALYAGEISRHELSVEQHTIRLSRLPDAFHGMRIVQISDFHYEEYTEAYFIRDVVRRVNRLRPDMVVFTGDFVSDGPMPHAYARSHAPACAEILSGIECPLRYAVLGNHDELVGAEAVLRSLEESGIPVLRNRFEPIERGNERIWLAGLGSASTRDARPEIAIPRPSITQGEPVVVLAHEPDILPEIARYNASLMLSGHTHGGQIRVPLLTPMFLPPLGRHYVEGLFHYEQTQLYVNRGIGAVGVPFRFRCPPEITVLTLV
jgi:predicted MPP superfamily phosphohydrolase